MKIKSIVYIFVFLFCSNAIYSQYRSGTSNLLNAKNPEDVGIRTAQQINADEQKPLEYGYVDDKDILWSTMIWEVIDLDERINFPLLYPVDTTVVGPERRPMIWWLKQEITRGRLDVYDPESEDGEFRRKLTDPVELENIWRKQSVLEAGKITIEDFQTFINEDVLTKEFDRFGFIPYEYYDIEIEELVILSEEQKAEIRADSIGTVFPYLIKNSKELNFNVYADSVISFELYNGFRQDIPVRKVMPGYEKSELDNEEITDIRRICLQLIRDYWIEDTHFIWEDLKFSQVKKWLVKGLWYFDKKYSELIYRPIGLAPVATEILTFEEIEAEQIAGGGGFSGSDDFGGGDDSDPFGSSSSDDSDPFGGGEPDAADVVADDSFDDPFGSGGDDAFDDNGSSQDVEQTIPLFWVYYPHARDILKKGKIFNDRNSSVSKSFDDIINSRRFNAVIYKEENVYENRYIRDYIPNNAFMRLLESERIKEKVRNFEHDMWSW
jgi:gliding motility associated protien GldN